MSRWWRSSFWEHRTIGEFSPNALDRLVAINSRHPLHDPGEHSDHLPPKEVPDEPALNTPRPGVDAQVPTGPIVINTASRSREHSPDLTPPAVPGTRR